VRTNRSERGTIARFVARFTWARLLWLPMGLHFGWNFTEGGVFGTAVSGGQSHGLI
jgi:uncharacterized protein